MRAELQLFLLFAIIIMASKLAGHVSLRYLRQPVVFGEILVGLLLGPTLLNIFGWKIFASSAGFLQEVVSAMAGLGVLLLMFVAGLETNLDAMRSVGKSALWTAVLGVILPLGFGVILSRLFALSWLESIFIGTILTATSVSITAQTLLELGHLASREGTTILGAAVIDDILGIIILSVVMAFGLPANAGEASLPATLAHWGTRIVGNAQATPYVQVFFTMLLIGAFFFIIIWLGPRLIHAVVSYAHRLSASHAITAAALFLALVFSVLAESVGQVAYITGAYLVGLILGQTSFRRVIEHSIHPFTYALFVPIFLMNIGMSADISDLAGMGLFVALLVGVAIVSKFFGCAIGARLTGSTLLGASRVGAGMISRGEVGLIVAQIGLVAGAITASIYVAVVVMVLVTTLLTPLLLRLLFSPVHPVVEAEVYESFADVEWDREDSEDF